LTSPILQEVLEESKETEEEEIKINDLTKSDEII